MRLPVVIDPRVHDAILFDLDGVLTGTASIHAKAWTSIFDELVTGRPAVLTGTKARTSDSRSNPRMKRLRDADRRLAADTKPTFISRLRPVSSPFGGSREVFGPEPTT